MAADGDDQTVFDDDETVAAPDNPDEATIIDDALTTTNETLVPIDIGDHNDDSDGLTEARLSCI